MDNYQNLHGAGMMAVMNRLEPDITARFEEKLRASDFSDEPILLMCQNPDAVIDYYIEFSRSQVTQQKEASLASSINVFPFRAIAQHSEKYLADQRGILSSP